MDFKVLFETQPNVVKLIQNSYKKGRLSQVYLFDGVKGTPKMQGAMYLASLLLCENHCNCGECHDCRLLEEGLHPRLFKIEPTKNDSSTTNATIKKEQIIDLEKEFTLTSKDIRVFIINEIDKATSGSSNTLLKFLEEMKENCYAILITDNLNSVISTIRSRSQIITFEKISRNILMNYYLSKSIESEMARILCTLTNNVSQGLELSKDSTINQIVGFVKKVNNAMLNKKNLVLLFNDEGKFLLSITDKKYHQIFIDLLITITNDRLYYLLGKQDEMVFLETIEHLDEFGCDLHAIDYNQTFKQIETILLYKERLLCNVNLELMYIDLFIKCEV